jgi:transducin (beta)-like 1
VSGVFGPLRPTSPVPEENLEIDRKRQIDSDQAPPQPQPGPPSKKARLSNGYDNDFNTTPMDLDDDQNDDRNGHANGDQNGDENAYPSPEQVPSPLLATTGPDQGTQIDKVNELTPETTFLELFEDPSRNAVVLQCEFSPRDSMILAAAGTDALARMWTLSRTVPETGSDSPAKPVLAPHINLLDDGVSTQATCLSWASDGSMLALSSEPPESGNAKIEFWTPDGARFASFNGFDPSIIALRWNPQNNACLAMCPLHEGKGALISVLSPYTHSTLRFPMPDHPLLDQPLDAAWTSDIEFIICGGGLLQAFRCAENEIIPGIQFETRPGDSLSKVAYDWRSSLLATASDSGTIDVSIHCAPPLHHLL